MSNAKKSLEVFLRGESLCAIKKLGNGEVHYVTIPYKHFSHLTSGEMFVNRLLKYLFGSTEGIAIDISFDAKAYILANCASLA